MQAPRSAERIGAALLALAMAAVAMLPMTGEAQQASVAGKLLFEKRCTGCHALDRHKEGPSLGGVFGRRAGTAAGFNYSAGLRGAGFAWDEARLERWLTDTSSLVEDNNMDFRVPKADERAAIIEYLKSLSAAKPGQVSGR